jgi:hypothetical protein
MKVKQTKNGDIYVSQIQNGKRKLRIKKDGKAYNIFKEVLTKEDKPKTKAARKAPKAKKTPTSTGIYSKKVRSNGVWLIR